MCMKGRAAGAQPPSASTSRGTPSPPDRGARLAPSPMDRGARPSAFAKLYYFMRPDRALMLASLALACLGEVCGMVPYLVVALLAAGLIDNTLIDLHP